MLNNFLVRDTVKKLYTPQIDWKIPMIHNIKKNNYSIIKSINYSIIKSWENRYEEGVYDASYFKKYVDVNYRIIERLL